jgi:two-component system, NtrC family, sensor kinase
LRPGDKLKVPFKGLRTGILAQLLFLIIAAMLLVNIVMLNLSQRNLMQYKAGSGRILINALSLHIGHHIGTGNRPLTDLLHDPETEKEIRGLLSEGGYPDLVITDANGNIAFSTPLSDEDSKILLNFARISLQETEMSVSYRGSTWGIFWLGKKYVSVSAPLIFRGKHIGGASISSSLDTIYKTLRESQKLVVSYIVLDTIVLALVGIYLLSRIVVTPIHRLLKMTEKYREEDILQPAPEDTGNEIGSLSRSMSMMLQKLDENKRELKGHISSLERANIELKQAQDKVIRSEKLASVGRLAAGIAHEIGNPLGIILGYLEMIRKGKITEDEKIDFLSRIESEITRINSIIRQLLDFSRPSTGNIEESRIHDIIADTVNMMAPHPMMEGINIRLDLNAERDKSITDSNRLQQVFLNIIMNAADVLKEHGAGGEHPSNNILITTENSDWSIEIKFTDNGPGIEKENIHHIFDPFYTTKDPGKGTGLGLSVSYMIVESLGGSIRAESALGKGTSIIISLPVHDGKHQGDSI